MNISINGLNVNYKVKGEQGDYIFLFHGWGSNIELFGHLMDELSVKYRAVAPDIPGFGMSQEPKTPWNIDEYVDFAVEFIKQFGCERVILIGHSHGGRIIIKLANRSGLPFAIDKIIMIDSAGIVPRRTFKYKFRVKMYKAGKTLLSAPPVKALFPDALDKFKKSMGSADYKAASDVMRQSMVKVVNEDLTPYLSGIKPTTLLIWGENDADTPLSDGKLMESSIKGAGLVVLKNAGHYSFLDQQYTFTKVVKSFLQIGES